MRSPATTGEECPGGSGVFQITLRPGPISAGRGDPVPARPEALAPRNCGQSEARTSAAKHIVVRKAIRNRLEIFHMVFILYLCWDRLHRNHLVWGNAPPFLYSSPVRLQ